MLFNLLLAKIKILLCFFFLFLVIFNNFFIIPIVKENTRLKLALVTLAGTPIALIIKKIIDIPPLVADKTVKALSKYSKAAMYLLSFLLVIFLS